MRFIPVPMFLIAALAGVSTLSSSYAQEMPNANPSQMPSGVPSSNVANSDSIQTKSGSFGSYLVDGQGKSLYASANDSANASMCSGPCAQMWLPFTVSGDQVPQGSGDVQSDLIGVMTREDGTRQVTYKGMALYYYSGDKSPEDMKGQGMTSFGALWNLVKPDGTPLMSAPAASASPEATPAASGGPAAPNAGGPSAPAPASSGQPNGNSTMGLGYYGGGYYGGCTAYTDIYGNISYSGNCAAASSYATGCVLYTDAYGNTTYSGSCAGSAGGFSGCTVSRDLYGNWQYSGSCASAATSGFSGCAAYTDAYGRVYYSGSCAASSSYFQGCGAYADAYGNVWYGNCGYSGFYPGFGFGHGWDGWDD